MPNIRQQNIKLFISRGRRHYVFNTHNAGVREFTSMHSMFSYHSENSRFIDVETSNVHYANAILHRKAYYVYGGFARLFTGESLSREEINANGNRFYNVAFYTGVNNALSEIRRRFGIIHMSATNVYSDSSAPILGESLNGSIDRTLIRGYHTTLPIHYIDESITTNADNKMYMGIELEIDRVTSQDDERKHRLATKLHSLLNNNDYNSFCKFERDGSLSANGFEIITQPITFNQLKARKEIFKEAFREIDRAGYTSHDNGRCGIHVHVSRTHLPDNALTNVFMIFENFKNELIAFSRRNQNQMRWAQFITDSPQCSEISKRQMRELKDRRNGHGYVINNQNPHTVEFRLFRGTTKVRTLFATLQLVDNIVKIANERECIEGLSWADIINYGDNEDLILYNEKRNIISKHICKNIIDRNEVTSRGVILIRPFQLNLEGDN